eukprot:TRINITY_DN1966_c1_g1_i1.p1 TRINITY_DN1966_c1_g1~~TRINITY_DN1966_c1_g1_i1.p1  ORF type:complete len:2017 (-),score=539.79 TRINITY_DN1966_c1_g1_i1:25-6075(-)
MKVTQPRKKVGKKQPDPVKFSDDLRNKLNHFGPETGLNLFKDALNVASDLNSQISSFKKIGQSTETWQKLANYPQQDHIKSLIDTYLHIMFDLPSTPIHGELLQIFQKIYSLNKSLEELFKSTLKTYISSFFLRISSETCTQAHISIIGTLSNSALLSSLLSQNTLDIYTFFGTFVGQYTNALMKNDTLYVREQMETVENMLQVMIGTFQKFRVSFLQDDDSSKKTKLFSLFGKALSDLLYILTCGNCSNDCIYSSGLLFVILSDQIFEVSKDPDVVDLNTFVKQQIVVSFFGDLVGSENHKSILNGMIVKQNENYNITSGFKSLDTSAQLAILRGLVVGCRQEVLLSPCSILKSMDVKAVEFESTILIDAIIPTLFQFCEVTTDRFSRYLAFQAIKAGLERVSEGLKSSLFDIPKRRIEIFIDRVLNLIYQNWEDSFEGIVHQIKQIFEFVLLIHETVSLRDDLSGNKEENVQFVVGITKKLLDLDWNTKGKYPMLIILLEKIGAFKFAALKPEFMNDLFKTMRNKNLGKQITLLLEAFLVLAKSEANSRSSQSDNEQEKVKSVFDIFCGPFVSALFDDSTFLRVSTYSLPVILQHFPNSLNLLIESMLNYRSNSKDMEFTSKHLRALLSVLKQARTDALIDAVSLQTLFKDIKINSFHDTDGKKIDLTIDMIIDCAVSHVDESIRLDALHILCNTRKQGEPTTPFERKMFNSFLSFNLVDHSTSYRQVKDVMFERMMLRIRDGVKKNYKYLIKTGKTEEVKYYVNYLNNLGKFLTSSLYPEASHYRMTNTVDYIKSLFTSCGYDELVPFAQASGVNLEIINSDSVSVLLNGLWDYFQENRTGAFDILKKLSAPFPGYTTPDKVEFLVSQTLRRINSPRMRECESACLSVGILMQKYVQEASWLINISADDNKITVNPNPSGQEKEQRMIYFINSFINIVNSHLKVAKTDLVKASMYYPMHGPLMAIRYILSNINFNDKLNLSQHKEWRDVVQRIIATAADVQATMWTYTHYITYRATVDGGSEEPILDPMQSSSTRVAGQSQAISICAWMCMKEVSLVLGTLVEQVPLPKKQQTEEPILSIDQIEKIGNTLLEILLSVLHEGAIEKTFTGLQAICLCLMKSENVELHELPEKWLNQLLQSVIGSAKLFKVITRRSAGFPFAIRAILRAEADTSISQKLLHKTFDHFIQLTDKRGDEDQTDTQIHALNTLRALLLDSRLMEDISHFIEQLLITVFTQYNSRHWSVRNSATMTFSVIIQRALGLKNPGRHNNKRPYLVSKGVTSCDFFNRMPKLRDFLINVFAESLSTTSKQDDDSNEKKAMKDSSQYAVLVLISCLLPTRMDSPVEIQKLAAFIPLVQQLSGSHQWKIREMSAKAMVPLISQQQLPQFISDTIDKIPTSKEHMKSSNINHNQLHGYLMQLYYVLSGHLPYVDFSDTKIKLFTTILPKLSDKLWIFKETCGPVSSMLLSILHEFVIDNQYVSNSLFSNADRKSYDDLYQNTLDVASEILNKPSPLQFNGNFMSFHLRGIAAKILLHLEITKKKEKKENSLSKLIIKLMTDPDYEIRLISLKLLKKLLTSSSSSSSSTNPSDLLLSEIEKEEIQSKLIHRLQNIDEESHVECRSLLLRNLNVINKPLPSESIIGMSVATTTESDDKNFFSILSKLVTSSQSSRTKEDAVRSMGFTLKGFIESVSSEPPLEKSKQVFEEWISLLQKYSGIDQPADEREAVLDSIELASLTKESVERLKCAPKLQMIVANATVTTWIIIINLLQDDEFEIRERAALFTAKTLCNSTLEKEKSTGPMKAVETVFSYLSQYFGDNELLLKYLFETISITEHDMKEFWPVSLEKEGLFELEKTNYFVEPLFLSQLSYKHLSQLLKNSKATESGSSSSSTSGSSTTTFSTLTQSLEDNIQSQYNSIISNYSSLFNNENSYLPKSMFSGWSGNVFTVIYKICVGVKLLLDYNKSEKISKLQQNVLKLRDYPNNHPVITGILSQIQNNESTTSTSLLFLTSYYWE